MMWIFHALHIAADFVVFIRDQARPSRTAGGGFQGIAAISRYVVRIQHGRFGRLFRLGLSDSAF